MASPSRDEFLRYMASTEFKDRAIPVWGRADGRCERCQCCPPAHTAHHSGYGNWGAETEDDLAALCAPCHSYIDGNTDDDHAAVKTTIVRIDATDDDMWIKRVCALGYKLGELRAAQPTMPLVWLEQDNDDDDILLGRLNPNALAAISDPWLHYRTDMTAPEWDAGKSFTRNRPLYPATCADCGAETQVPFEATSGYARCYRCFTGKDGEFKGARPAPVRLPTEVRRDLTRASAEDIARMLGSKAPANTRRAPWMEER